MIRMPKMYSIAVVALALLLAVSTPVARADNVQGTLLAVDGDNHLFTLNTDDGQTLNFRVEVTAAVRIGAQERTIWDMQPGMHVTVDFRRDGRELICQSIATDQP